MLDCVATQGRDTASQATTRRWAGALGARGAQAAWAWGARSRQEHAGRAAGRLRRAGRAERGRGARLKSNLTRLNPNLGLALSNNKINK